MNKFFRTAIGLTFITVLVTVKSYATELPIFPSCLNPVGDIKAQYSEGIHGIVGDSGHYTGSDTVYNINADMVLQCFCPPAGQGIQTNWMKISGLSEYEIESFKGQGWIYVPTGSVWGLKNEAYLAKNIAFSCMSQSSSNVTLTSASTPGGSSSSPGGGSSAGPSSSGGGSSSSGSSSSGPGLASTGSWMAILETALIGALFTTGGYFIKKGSRS